MSVIFRKNVDSPGPASTRFWWPRGSATVTRTATRWMAGPRASSTTPGACPRRATTRRYWRSPGSTRAPDADDLTPDVTNGRPRVTVGGMPHSDNPDGINPFIAGALIIIGAALIIVAGLGMALLVIINTI